MSAELGQSFEADFAFFLILVCVCAAFHHSDNDIFGFTQIKRNDGSPGSCEEKRAEFYYFLSGTEEPGRENTTEY